MQHFRVLYALALITVFFAISGCRTYKYESGRDTIEMLGDGRYQIGKVSNGYGLFDATSPLGVAMNVSDWKEQGKFAYVIGEEGFQQGGKKYLREFFLIDISKNQITKYSTLSAVPVPHRQAFKSLRKM